MTTAKDGPDAIERIKEHFFYLIFTDIIMPLMKGMETFRKSKETKSKEVVTMMTAYTVEDLVQRALKEGANVILYKPLDMESSSPSSRRRYRPRKGHRTLSLPTPCPHVL